MKIAGYSAVLLSTLVALITVWAFGKLLKKEPEEVKYRSLDGLRGYLGFFVFLHHAYIYYFFLQTGQWSEPTSNLFQHLGKASVSFFFMITSFLFVGRLIDKRGQQMDWLGFFVARIMRLSPVYVVSIILQIILIFYIADWKLSRTPGETLVQIWQWLTFTAFGFPAMNDVPDCLQTSCGVMWSLVYEWVFYLLLPLIGLFFFKIRSSDFVMLIVLIVLYFIFKNNDIGYLYFIVFSGGIVAAFASKSEKFRKIASSNWASPIIIIALVCVIKFYHNPMEYVPIALFTLVFVLIACGNSVFGILNLKISRLLGQLAYSIYMFQGLALFITFKFVVGYSSASLFSPEHFWLMIVILTPLFIAFCIGLHYLIEKPAMKKSARITSYLHRQLSRVGIEKE